MNCLRQFIFHRLCFAFFFFPLGICAQSVAVNAYSVNLADAVTPTIQTNHLRLGTNINKTGAMLDANSLYFTKNGKPWFPVMGEFHFSRFPSSQWESSILKLKANGVDVIATYVFWIYHEEKEGSFDWTGDRDLRAFVALCAKHNMYVLMRVGPWCHGEVRNGGYPDWLLKKAKTRSNDPEYLRYVAILFHQINQQLKGYYYKDGGTIIGAQIENEFRFNNPKGLQHVLTLRKMAIDAGIDVPYYTATGWPGSDLKQTELVPVWGGYPEAPWDKKTNKLPARPNYLFSETRDDAAIGADLLGKRATDSVRSGYQYPYATAEMGSGIEVTYHRRPIIKSNDVTGLAYVKIGSGANLIGYYMYHGGSNKIGQFSTLQESQETNYPNDYPIISYDFQAPISEWGELRPSYRSYKKMHLFLNNFGDVLAQQIAIFPKQNAKLVKTTDTLRWAVRAKYNKGFVFVSNFHRQIATHDIANVQFNVILTNGAILHFPEKPITIVKDVQLIFPFNLALTSGVTVQYATAQLLCKINNVDAISYAFFAPMGISPEYVLDGKAIKTITATNATVTKEGAGFKIIALQPSTNCVITIVPNSGKKIQIITLTNEQASNIWQATVWGKERLFIAAHDLVFPDKSVRIQSTGNANLQFSVYPDAANLFTSTNKILTKTINGVFSQYSIALPEKKLTAIVTKDSNEGADTASAIAAKLAQQTDLKLKSPNTQQRPGNLYGATLHKYSNFPMWNIAIPPNALADVSDAFVRIDYTGDTGGAYANGTLIADDFYNGLPMTIGLKRFEKTLPGKKIQFQIVPLTDERDIFFEEGIRAPLKGKTVAEVKSVSIVPQYEITVIQKN